MQNVRMGQEECGEACSAVVREEILARLRARRSRGAWAWSEVGIRRVEDLGMYWESHEDILSTGE